MFTDEYFTIAKNVRSKYPEIFNNLALYKNHQKLKKIELKTRINLTIDPVVYEKFKSYCSINGMKVSAKIEQLMKEEIQK